ncbi:tol-pal system protein YbgF [Nitratireductor mangrovi]|uniref:Cell division coordinator CpoB n=1 Tax=Nitratireductor mangrovi TaxID=2599600 RepID=A0A5B8KWJ4_9HYPH|nr:tol-pal system protein YbgF [Nitratireductor mangrovi]QDY99962.1 tol-pal system protein YbgF [Nitratireductor mangrovi]
MKSKITFLVAVALPFAFSALAHAGPAGMPVTGLRAVDGAAKPRILKVQANDPRIGELEEQVRQLTGKVEELTFMILQMQEQVRKMQEDNEFRFQQLEEKRTDAGAASPQRQAADGATDESAGSNDRGELPKNLGTITFDENGNPTGGTVETDNELPGVEVTGEGAGEARDETVVAALPDTDNPDELYRNAYSFILSGDYSTAEAGFREHIERFPDDEKTPDAHYWLGEALLGKQEYRGAAEIFLNASRDYPQSTKAPDMLLKLGVSLAALNQRDVACATYQEIGKRYQNLSPALKERVKAEQALAGC